MKTEGGAIPCRPSLQGILVMTPSTAPEAGLSLRDIGKRYGPNVVLGGVTLDVRPGEVIALL
jgi:hypothetical protein